MDDILILGSGLAGYTLAREIRAIDTEIPLHMITADAGDFYSKPMLSNGLQQGKDAEGLISASAALMAERNRLTIDTGCRVTGISDVQRKVITEKGDHEYGSLVLALGAHPIIPAMGGDAADQRSTINSLYDYAWFRQRLPAPPAHIAIIGPGLIGCEFANDLLIAGYQVTLIGPDPYPISTLLPEATGKALEQAMQKAGAQWRLQQTAAIMEQADKGYRLTLTDASTLSCDLVLSAVGLRPEIALAAAAGLKVARGVVTDRLLQSSGTAIYALGDCAEVAGHNLPYVMPIMHAARALAKTLTGQPAEVVYPAMPVVIKTPLHPVVVAPPGSGVAGDWHIEQHDKGTRCLFQAPEGGLLGFVISGGFMDEKQALTRCLPPVLAASVYT
ncbi:MAG: FAD-dependent oxidoreductase [Candidatus Thiodiazotropha sp. (ex Epidulcina cf. delphinae)]|nr:FAD-dependent oxidoreductase [Candidatus Thiodiazotropha sp. (ex Epidulcina cf. delphinae)]